ncbi:MAG: FAD-dependent oxidoreductase [bacterium]
MTETEDRGKHLRVAIVGAGPAGFYAAERLLNSTQPAFEIDIIDRVPTPFGLVRSGVAPDHQKIKAVSKVFDRVAQDDRCRFFGNLTFGEHVTREDLHRHYHAIIYATGAQADRHLDVPGEDLRRVYSATDFVAWYNGHPHYRDLHFDLSSPRVAIIGVGNVAVDVARMLCRSPNELAKTDIADYALETLRHSAVETVYLIGRRGPVQAAFTLPELKELQRFEDVTLVTRDEEMVLDEHSQKELEATSERSLQAKVEILRSLVGNRRAGANRKRLEIRFLLSSTAVRGDGSGCVGSLRLVRNELCRDERGRVRPQPTDQYETLRVGAVFRSVGYRGVALPDVPFDERQGVIPNERGRVIDPDSGQQLAGEYTAGWIKRGPTGQIGTNKADAAETIASLLADAQVGRLPQPENPAPEAPAMLIAQRQQHVFTYDDWQRLDTWEREHGAQRGRPRLKLTSIEDMLAVCGRARRRNRTLAMH